MYYCRRGPLFSHWHEWHDCMLAKLFGTLSVEMYRSKATE